MDEENIIAETENFVIWTSDEEGDLTYHVELGGITIHIGSEEWDELVTLFKSVE